MKRGIYILTNPLYEDTYKIGCSNNLDERIYSSTYTTMYLPDDVPKLKYIIHFSDNNNIEFYEKIVHKLLSRHRLSDVRELFELIELKKQIKKLHSQLLHESMHCTLYTTLNDVPETNTIITTHNNHYNYQTPIVTKLIDYFNDSSKGILSCPPGYGKTYITANFIKQTNYHNYLILCPQIMICDEFKIALQSLIKQNINIVIVNSDNNNKITKYRNKKNVIITTYQSYPLHSITNMKCVIYDEAHHTCCGKEFTKLLTINSDKKLFITATPKIITYGENDKTETFSMNDEDIYGPVIHRAELSTAIDKKILCDYKLYFPSVNKADPISIVDKMVNLYSRKRIVLFFNTVRESKKVYKRLLKSNLCDDVFELNANTKRKDKLNIKHTMDDNTDNVYVLCNVNIIGEGVSIKRIDSIVFCENRQSSIGLYQNIGRGLRWHENKDLCLVVVTNKFCVKNVFGSLFEYDSRLRNEAIRRNKCIGDIKVSTQYEKVFKLIEINRDGGQWEYKCKLFFEYVEEFKKIPIRRITYKGHSIGRWYSHQKENVNNREDIRYQKLCKNDIVKNNLNKYIERKLSQDSSINLLFQYVEEFQKIPTCKTMYKGRLLGRWYLHQRGNVNKREDALYQKLCKYDTIRNNIDEYIKKKNKKKLSQKDKLNLLLQYVKEFKKIPPLETSYHDINIGTWYCGRKKLINTCDDIWYQRLCIHEIIKNNLERHIKNKNKKILQEEILNTFIKYIGEFKKVPPYGTIYCGIKLNEWFCRKKLMINNSEHLWYKKLCVNDVTKKYINNYIEKKKNKPSQNDLLNIFFQCIEEFKNIPPQGTIYNGVKIIMWYNRKKIKINNYEDIWYKKLSTNDIIKDDLNKYIKKKARKNCFK